MKRSMLFSIFGLIALMAVAVIPASALDVDELDFPELNELKMPDIEQVTMDNGIRLYLLEDHALPTFDVAVRINVGSYLEPGDKVGLASICGTVMRTGGTQKWTGDEIDEALEAVGGSVETSIGLSSGSARVNVLSENMDLGLKILAEILRNPAFDEDRVELARVQARSSISRRNDDPQQIAFREFRKAVYGSESPYARHTEYKTINAISRDDLVAFHSKYFHPQNIQMSIWGDFDKKELIALLEKYFGDWQQGGEPVPPLSDVDYEHANKAFYIDKPDVNQSNVVLGHIGGQITDPDYADRIVMNNILGGGFGSRLFNNVRSKEGLAYATFGVYSANIGYPGLFYAFASTKSGTTIKAAKEIIKQIESMQTTPPTGDEMRMAKDGYLNSFVFNFDTKSEVVNRLMNYDYYGLPEDFLFKVQEQVQNVTPDDVMTAAKNNLQPDQLHILAVGNGDEFEMGLAEAGLATAVDTIDITIPSAEEKQELEITDQALARGMELLKQSAQAHGGEQAFDQIESVHRSGELVVQTPNGPFPLQFESLAVLPDKSREVVTVMGQKIYAIRSGNTGWETPQPGMPVGPMSEESLAERKQDDMRNTIRIFQSLDDPYYRALYVGTDEMAGKTVDVVVLLDDEGDEIVRLGLDPASHAIVAKSYYGETQAGPGTIMQSESNLSEVDGVTVPMTVTREMNGQTLMTIETKSIAFNEAVPPDAFTEPQ